MKKQSKCVTENSKPESTVNQTLKEDLEKAKKDIKVILLLEEELGYNGDLLKFLKNVKDYLTEFKNKKQ